MLGGFAPIAFFNALIFAAIPLAVGAVGNGGAVILIGRDRDAGSDYAPRRGSVVFEGLFCPNKIGGF